MCTQLAADDFTLMQGLQAGRRPAEAKPAITDFIARLARDRGGLMLCARASTLGGQDVWVGVANAAEAGAAANVVRIALDLPASS